MTYPGLFFGGRERTMIEVLVQRLASRVSLDSRFARGTVAVLIALLIITTT